MRNCILLFSFIFTLVGCHSGFGKITIREEYFLNPDMQMDKKTAIKNHLVLKGMIREEVVAALGEPESEIEFPKRPNGDVETILIYDTVSRRLWGEIKTHYRHDYEDVRLKNGIVTMWLLGADKNVEIYDLKKKKKDRKQ